MNITNSGWSGIKNCIVSGNLYCENNVCGSMVGYLYSYSYDCSTGNTFSGVALLAGVETAVDFVGEFEKGYGGTGPSPTCFVAQTKVSTPNGYKNIEDIQIGDIVYSMNLETNQVEEKSVTRLKTTENGCQLAYLIYTGEKYIESTPDHRFYVKDKGWKDACELNKGDILINEKGNEKAITEIQTKEYDEPVTVYNFEVEDNRNYFVGEDNILVYTIPE